MVLQDYDIDRGSGWYQKQMFSEAVQRYKPDKWDQVDAIMDRYLVAGQGNPIHYIGRTITNAFDESATIPKEEWPVHPSYREGLDWFEGITELQAELDAEQLDREEYYSGMMKNTDQFAAHNLGAMLGTALFDPLTYVPFLGTTARIRAMGTKVANRFKTVSDLSESVSYQNTSMLGRAAKGLLSPFKPVGVFAAEAGFAETAFQLIKGASRQGRDSDHVAALTDIGIATLAGGVLGTIPMAKQLKSQFSNTQLADFLGRNVNDFKRWGYSKFDGTGSTSPREYTKEEAMAEWKRVNEDQNAARKAEHNKALHPVVEHVKRFDGDVKSGLGKLLDKFFNCKWG